MANEKGGACLIQHEFKDYLKQQADLVEVIRQFTPVHKIGNNFMANCIFHEDTHPSLLIKPQTKTFYCLGCHAGSTHHSRVQSSDVYGFLKGALDTNFKGAMEWLSRFLNIPMPAMHPEYTKKMDLHQSWVKRCDENQHRFTENLKKNNEALRYLSSRGLTSKDIETWKLGFGDNQDPYFLNANQRIAFPLFDYYGEIISFTGRLLLSDQELKALNLGNESKKLMKYQDRFPIKSDSPLFEECPYPEFQKRQFLYGMHIAKQYIRQYGVAIVVEGWMDVIMMHKCGAMHTVSTMGTMFTKEQLDLLKRAGAKMILTMRDGDSAGQQAAKRDVALAHEHGLQCFIVPLPLNIDPFDLAKQFLDQREPEKLLEYIRTQSKPIIQWNIEQQFRSYHEQILSHYSQIAMHKSHAMQSLISLLQQIQDPLERSWYTKLSAELYEISIEDLKFHIESAGESLCNLMKTEESMKSFTAIDPPLMAPSSGII